MADIRYGYDHCRICGKSIRRRRPEGLEDWLEAQRKPPIPEAEWRRRGFLAAPTKFQLVQQPADGCCPDCGIKMTHKFARYTTRAVGVTIFGIVVAVIVSVIVLYVRQ